MRVLFVDAGNYCRSPAAEAVAKALAAKQGVGAKFAFGSAGLKDKHAGDTADPRTIEACAKRGYDLGAFRCREITEADFLQSDLILAMDQENLAQLRARRPAGTKVLRRGGRLRADDGPDRGRGAATAGPWLSRAVTRRTRGTRAMHGAEVATRTRPCHPAPSPRCARAARTTRSRRCAKPRVSTRRRRRRASTRTWLPTRRSGSGSTSASASSGSG